MNDDEQKRLQPILGRNWWVLVLIAAAIAAKVAFDPFVPKDPSVLLERDGETIIRRLD